MDHDTQERLLSAAIDAARRAGDQLYTVDLRRCERPLRMHLSAARKLARLLEERAEQALYALDQ